MTDEMIESLIRRALESENGIRVSTTNLPALKRKCYVVRRELVESGETKFSDLSFIDAPEDLLELWIIKRSKLSFDPRPPGLRT